MPPLKIKYLLSILFCVSISLKAQTVHCLTNNTSLQINTYEVLPDKHYSFDQIRSSTTLRFAQNDSLNTSAADYYWIKMIVENPYPNNENYRISLSLKLNYILYFFDNSTQKWISYNAGLGESNKGTVSCTLQGRTRNILYLKIDVRDIQSYGYAIKPAIIMEKEISFNSRKDVLWISWLLCIAVLISFACYNLFVYFQLKDEVYLCYLVVQLGAIVFITSFKHFFNLLLPFGFYNIRLNADGSTYNYDLNSFLLHIGCIIIFSGTIQLTRSYLRTKELLPAYDNLLKYALYTYAGIELPPAIITIAGIYYLDSYTLIYDNIAILIISLLIFFTCIVAYKRHIRAAKYFLLANTLPLIFGTFTAVFFIINSAPTYTNNGSFLPEIAIISQIFTFAVALVARIRIVNEELKAKELEVGKLAADIALTEYKHTLIEKENEFIISAIQQEKDKNELLQQKLEINQRELVGNSLYIHQKNKLLADLKDQIQDIDNLYPHVKHPGLKSIKSSLKDSQYLDLEWDKFKLHFEQVHPDFFKTLRSKHPSLTQNELRLYAYFHIHLSTKEIAALLNIAPASVRQAKARLNKKMAGAFQSPEQN
ncbi:7TM diverse intracellular signalling [Chitinophaga sp. YR573]|uniref:7TM diverse intracellular signaling domain-containing protein n=1 Tax=Chitinophaga sp. YR573 TaxID=1881040 RepID=UPI0008B94B30|nr:7TM diverse intracellular signaling domain-containing protein [Chitinophaga sp. YR573]SEW14736.1 7TM diverse intracellular signalling [Chitinophaga sp. YR573]